ncbi:hypothetical protein MMC10_004137 [Thelotrema lepadinum]|nr:hypothetical protein [Thelotrema lepadinum]
MSATSEPITLARFTAAITELPLSSLFAKGAEIRNSIAHLEVSNTELKSFADAGDRDCADALEENVAVLARMQTRLELLEVEVGRRGFNWNEAKGIEPDSEPTDSDNAAQEIAAETRNVGTPSNGTQQPARGGPIEDAEPANSADAQIEDDDDTEENGLHL